MKAGANLAPAPHFRLFFDVEGNRVKRLDKACSKFNPL